VVKGKEIGEISNEFRQPYLPDSNRKVPVPSDLDSCFCACQDIAALWSKSLEASQFNEYTDEDGKITDRVCKCFQVPPPNLCFRGSESSSVATVRLISIAPCRYDRT
jgi:hypothetical protein